MSSNVPFSDPLSVPAAAAARRSIRKYTSDPISDETLAEILRVAGLAPSPWNVQPWRVIAVRDPEAKAQLQANAYGQPQVGGAAVTLVVYSDMADALANLDEVVHPGFGDKAEGVKGQIQGALGTLPEADRETWGNGISYIFLGYLMLAAQSMGYSSSPMLGFDAEKVKAQFGLPSHVRVPALLAMGVADEEGFSHFRLPVERFLRTV